MFASLVFVCAVYCAYRVLGGKRWTSPRRGELARQAVCSSQWPTGRPLCVQPAWPLCRRHACGCHLCGDCGPRPSLQGLFVAFAFGVICSRSCAANKVCVDTACDDIGLAACVFRACLGRLARVWLLSDRDVARSCGAEMPPEVSRLMARFRLACPLFVPLCVRVAADSAAACGGQVTREITPLFLRRRA